MKKPNSRGWLTTMTFGKLGYWQAQRRHQAVLLAFSLGWILLAGFAHYQTGPQYEFHLAFLIPVVAVCWFIGLKAGVFTTLVSATVWMVTDWPYASDPGVLLVNEAVRLSVFFLVVILVDRLRLAFMREVTLARVDTLTQLANRRNFYELAGVEIARARRYARSLTLISLDLDNFKSVNDNEGHDAGDRVLQTVGETLRNNIRSIDVAGRIGGDEFVIMLPETGYEAATEITTKLQQKLTHAMQAEHWPVTGSFGVATFVTPPESVDELIKHADQLLYAAKHKGKNIIYQEIIDNAPR